MDNSGICIYANGVKIYQANAKKSERKSYPLSLGSISRDFAIHKIEKTELNKYSNNFCVS